MPDGSVTLAERYRLESRIAFGGVGEVWRATDLMLGRTVAVKLLRDGYADHPETLARFREEARHAGSLAHPGIAQVYDYGEASPPRSPYLVMELVDGPSLAQVLARGPLGPARAMDVVAQAAAGLAAAHRAGLVHRDIKPANLLLGPDGRVKITDFGIAHAAGSAPLTQTGTLMGTPAYLAPERAGGASATPASDLYSLGVVAFECLAGAPPFSGTPLEVTLAHQNRPLPPLPAAIPADVAALVAELTAKDPAARPASADDVAARAGRLQGAATGSGLAAAPFAAWHPPPESAAADQATPVGVPLPVPLTPRAARWRLRARSGHAVVLAMAVTAVLAGLGGWLLAGSPGQQVQRQRAPVPPAVGSAAATPPQSRQRQDITQQPREAQGKVSEPGDDHGRDPGDGNGNNGDGNGGPGSGGPGNGGPGDGGPGSGGPGNGGPGDGGSGDGGGGGPGGSGG